MSTGPRRSSRQSTPTSPPNSTRRSGMSVSASTPSLSSLAAPTPVRKSTRRSSASPAPESGNRPALPRHAYNGLLQEWKGRLHKVKTQTLNLGSKTNGTITIARVKCPVPKNVPGHVIKRFDTDAVSASSLFRAAYPLATNDEEEKEMKWISKGSRGRYGDTQKAGCEHDESRKLTGTWIPTAKATMLAEEYDILKFAQELISFPITTTQADSEAVDSEADSPAVKSPRSKRPRVLSPTSPRDALSGASGKGVSIMQTLSTDPTSGIVTETTEVKVDVADSGASKNGATSQDAIDREIEKAKALVQELKEAGTLQDMTEATTLPGSRKRALEQDADDVDLPTSGTLADVVDTRGFFGKIFKRPPRRVATAGREIKQAGSQIALVQPGNVNPEGRRWVAGSLLAVTVAATAAAPYLFG